MTSTHEQIQAEGAHVAEPATAPLTCDLALAQPTQQADLAAQPATQPARIPRTQPQVLADQLVADELIKGAPSRNGGRLLTAERDPWTHNAWCARRLRPRQCLPELIQFVCAQGPSRVGTGGRSVCAVGPRAPARFARPATLAGQVQRRPGSPVGHVLRAQQG